MHPVVFIFKENTKNILLKLNNTQIRRINAISGFHREADEICAFLGNYTAYSDHSLPKFRNNLSVPSSRAKNYFGFLTYKVGPKGCSETPVRNYHYTQRNFPEQRRTGGREFYF
jgi:hypothetical protein